jgi:predicted nucleic acid-binding protein
MKVVVDTNIIFSALLKANSPIADILLNPHEDIDFYAPELLKEELALYTDKIRKYSKLSTEQLLLAKEKTLNRIIYLRRDIE